MKSQTISVLTFELIIKSWYLIIHLVCLDIWQNFDFIIDKDNNEIKTLN